MKLTRTEFEAQLGIARTLPKDARKALLDSLKSADVYEKDADGNEVQCKMTVVELDAPEQKQQAQPETITQADIDKMVADAIKAVNKPASPGLQPVEITVRENLPIPALSKRFGAPLRCFKGTLDGKSAEQRAYEFGMWALATVKGSESAAAKWCAGRGFPLRKDYTKTHNETTDSAGGYTVPEQFLGDLINLVNEFGVFRRNARTIPMTSETFRQPRVSGRLTAYVMSENTTGTTSDATFDSISLTAKKIGVTTSLSSELNEDTAVALGDWLASDIARAFAYFEDNAGFNGDGTAGYASITGVRTALSTLNGVDEGGGLIIATGDLFSEFVIGDFAKTVGICPTYALMGAAWYCTPFVFNATMQRLAYASGGVTTGDLKTGDLRPNFLGYPVNLVEVMPNTDSTSQLNILFGNLAQAATFGDRRMPTIKTSEHVYFNQDAIAVLGTERFDINVHDVGTASVAGPIVGLMSKAS